MANFSHFDMSEMAEIGHFPAEITTVSGKCQFWHVKKCQKLSIFPGYRLWSDTELTVKNVILVSGQCRIHAVFCQNVRK